VSAVRHTATTGLDELDRALGGLYWGDNVVWDAEAADDAGPFYAAVAATAWEYDAAAYVTLTESPERVEARYQGLEVLDARSSGDLAQPRPLLDACGRWCAQPGRRLLLLESLDAMSDRWGTETAGRFFTLGCPMLLGLGAIAFWSLTTSRHPSSLRREIEDVTQCVLSLGDGRLRIIKAEGRRAGVEGSVFRYHVERGLPVLEPAPAAARLGAALRDLRRTRRLSQADIARLAGVSPSAISQAERGRRGLSLETLLHLTSRLNMTLDELLRGQEAPGYRLARRDDPRHATLNVPVPLLDDPGAGLRAYVLRLSPGARSAPTFPHKGVELVAVASGLVQVVLATGTPVLRAGEALIADRSGVSSWRNLTDGEALVFWVLHDESAGDGTSPATG
jgi:transcriptional regulator with XRE-family HTH domain